MTKIKITGFVILAISLMQIANAQIRSTGDVKDNVTVDTLNKNSIYGRIWQPYIAKWNEKTYVIAYGRQLKGKTDMGDILCTVSKDKGKSWNTPVIIFNSQIQNGTLKYAYANAVLYKDPEQNLLWCYAMRCPQYYANSEESEICAAYSGDGGLTWFPIELINDFHSPLIIVAGIMKLKDQNGQRYLLPAHRNTKHADPMGDRLHFVLESHDLIHWKLASYVPLPEPKVFMHEGNIAEWNNSGELKMVMRTATYEDYKPLDPPVAYSTKSTDGGKTWSTGKPEPLLYNAVSKAFFGKDSLGNHIYVYSSGPREDRKELWYKTKQPGKEWSDSRLFYFDNNRNSYPTLLEVEPGEWICTWDSSNEPNVKRSVIRFGKISTKNL